MLQHRKVDLEIFDEEGNTLEDVVRAEKGLSEPNKGTALRLLEEARNRGWGVVGSVVKLLSDNYYYCWYLEMIF